MTKRTLNIEVDCTDLEHPAILQHFKKTFHQHITDKKKGSTHQMEVPANRVGAARTVDAVIKGLLACEAGIAGAAEAVKAVYH